MEKQNSLLNFLKGIGCLGVVFIHVKFPGMLGDIVWRLAQFAVPIFFMISGYYAYSSNREQTTEMLFRRMKRVFRISVISTGIYAVCPLGKMDTSWMSMGGSQAAMISGLRFVVLNDVDFACGHLWFLWALVYVYGILWWLNEKNRWELAHKTLVWLFLLYVTVYVVRFYWGLSWHVTGNWLVIALPFVLLGHFIAWRREVLKGIFANSQLIMAAVIGVTISLVVLAKPLLDFSVIGLIVYAASLFLLAVKNPDVHICRPLELIGENYSLYIYVVHMLVASIVQELLRNANLANYDVSKWLIPVIVAACSLLVARGCVCVVKKECFKKVG